MFGNNTGSWLEAEDLYQIGKAFASPTTLNYLAHVSLPSPHLQIYPTPSSNQSATASPRTLLIEFLRINQTVEGIKVSPQWQEVKE
jgi:hypothetical protein